MESHTSNYDNLEHQSIWDALICACLSNVISRQACYVEISKEARNQLTNHVDDGDTFCKAKRWYLTGLVNRNNQAFIKGLNMFDAIVRSKKSISDSCVSITSVRNDNFGTANAEHHVQSVDNVSSSDIMLKEMSVKHHMRMNRLIEFLGDDFWN